MAGLYIHIPFCKQACYYCDFHFSTNLSGKEELVKYICKELILQKDYIGKEAIETIYLGGGTPSILSQKELENIFQVINDTFIMDPLAEITLEANPDDLTDDKLDIFQTCGINRLSVGVQSFYEPHLHYLNRSHTKQQAKDSIIRAQKRGFQNISVDLIYGIPHSTHSILKQDLSQLIELEPTHISAYCLTIESKTVFGNWLKKGKIFPIEDLFAAEQFDITMEKLEENRYEHYEISNFAQPGYISIHNSNYWKQKKYLGVGPSAHSYNGNTRQHNISNNISYIHSIKKGIIPASIENLTIEEKINEYILTGLRTKWGCDLRFIKKTYHINLQSIYSSYIQQLLDDKFCILEKETIILTKKGKYVADEIASRLFIV